MTLVDSCRLAEGSSPVPPQRGVDGAGTPGTVLRFSTELSSFSLYSENGEISSISGYVNLGHRTRGANKCHLCNGQLRLCFKNILFVENKSSQCEDENKIGHFTLQV